mgnify:CR=1 FL=1
MENNSIFFYAGGGIDVYSEALKQSCLPTSEINVKLLRTGEQLLKYDTGAAMLLTQISLVWRLRVKPR